jgi:hypothetical protein
MSDHLTDALIWALCSRTLRVALPVVALVGFGTVLGLRRYEQTLTRTAGDE